MTLLFITPLYAPPSPALSLRLSIHPPVTTIPVPFTGHQLDQPNHKRTPHWVGSKKQSTRKMNPILVPSYYVDGTPHVISGKLGGRERKGKELGCVARISGCVIAAEPRW